MKKRDVHRMRYTYTDPVSELWASSIGAQSVRMEIDYEIDEIYVAGECDECSHSIVLGNGGYTYCEECEEEVYLEGPLMSWYWPIELRRDWTTEDAALAVYDLPLCVVDRDGTLYFGLTGGGMDLSWEIAEGYMRIGLLPPVAVAKLPDMCKRPTKRNLWVLAGARKACRIARQDLAWKLRDISSTRQAMLGRR